MSGEYYTFEGTLTQAPSFGGGACWLGVLVDGESEPRKVCVSGRSSIVCHNLRRTDRVRITCWRRPPHLTDPAQRPGVHEAVSNGGVVLLGSPT